MPVFAVLAEESEPDLGKLISSKFKDNSYSLATGQWLIDANETAKSLTEELDLPDKTVGKVVVFKVDSYYGYHDKDLWDWLELPRSNGD